MILDPSFAPEELYWQQGITHIAGIDEVGMGALAGPVVAAAVILKPTSVVTGVRDSKVVSAKKREELSIIIKEQAVAWGIGEASVAEITRLNIRGASHLAMARAIAALAISPELLLIDGNPAQIHPGIPTTNIINGDALSYSIAAASIIAKVHRDALMAELDAEFPAYGFGGHKGYGSAKHLQALQEYGVTPLHRPTYAPVARLLVQAAT